MEQDRSLTRRTAIAPPRGRVVPGNGGSCTDTEPRLPRSEAHLNIRDPSPGMAAHGTDPDRGPYPASGRPAPGSSKVRTLNAPSGPVGTGRRGDNTIPPGVAEGSLREPAGPPHSARVIHRRSVESRPLSSRGRSRREPIIHSRCGLTGEPPDPGGSPSCSGLARQLASRLIVESLDRCIGDSTTRKSLLRVDVCVLRAVPPLPTPPGVIGRIGCGGELQHH